MTKSPLRIHLTPASDEIVFATIYLLNAALYNFTALYNFD